jgi:HD-like signal output (HDOD) protein/CheY-like chemotaxis protein
MKQVMFVDDEAQILGSLRASLYKRRKDWQMHFVPGGEQALAMLRESQVDVLVTDLRMPGMDGTTLLARAKAEFPDTIRIVLSGYPDDRQSQRLAALAHRYLSKPCEPRGLEECIERCLATQSLIQSDEVRRHLGGVTSLPPMPTTFFAMQRALSDPDVDAGQISAIIRKDPAIAAKVLQVCNSAFFRLPRRITSIQHAVSFLGLPTVRSMALSAELFKSGSRLSPALNLDQMQRHSSNVAVLAYWLARDATWADDAFLSGLLHDLGILFLGRQYPERMQEALGAAAAGMPLAQAEMEHVGIEHTTAGAYLLGLWGLPYEIVETVAHHGTPAGASDVVRDASGAVRVAHCLLETIRPQDVPAYDRGARPVGDEMLQANGFADSWQSLLENAEKLLNAGEAA